MWTPNTINKWLDERITFIENILSSTNQVNYLYAFKLEVVNQTLFKGTIMSNTKNNFLI